MKNKGFRIINLQVKNHYILKSNDFKFYDSNDGDVGPYFTVIIGANGTGKSEILRCLLEIWRDFYQQFNEEEFRPLQFSYTLHYSLEGKEYKYSNLISSTLISLTGKNKGYPKSKLYNSSNEEVTFNKDNYYKVFPLQVVAQSIMMTDKFFVPRNEKEKLRFAPYHYLGIRNRPQQSSTGYYVRRTVDLIIRAIEKKYFNNGIKKLVEFMETSGSFIVQYKTSNTKMFFTGELTPEILDSHFKEIELKYKDRQAPYKLGHFNRLKKNPKALLNLVDFINLLVKNSRLEKIERSSAKTLNFDLLIDGHLDFLKKHQYDIDWLRKIGLLSNPVIKFSDNNVELQRASSGEFHLFTTMIGIMASTRKNSLVIIDEPEISLHPNWQMRYIEFIRELFKDTNRVTAHIIIATHSHFLVSDLYGESSNIIGLRKEDNMIKSIEINKDTYGWSSEDVLYNVFNVKSPTNYYLQADLTELLGMVSNNIKDANKIESIIKKLKKLPKRDNDPLQEIIIESEEYLNSIK
ncbi:AAA family ATPase [Maribacter confluentis]|uniref:AAA family ATPase n=1 Tax=Maribacter confluentis TaxID=1656093 RepID=A0ABT8RJ94_9FLAO|nr:AAA family ATPase [Maribacter confluentis]MDO1511136.1 AAA family ATPase [Maribacter confluentis]